MLSNRRFNWIPEKSGITNQLYGCRRNRELLVNYPQWYN